MATVTSKGQVTLPKAIRDELGLKAGSQVDFEVEAPGKIVMRKRVDEEAFRRWEGFLDGKLPAACVDEFIDMLRGEVFPSEVNALEDSA